MAIPGHSFKISCPSCESGVVIKNPKLIGKKVECPTCKFRFVVDDPADSKPEDESPKSKKRKKPVPDDEDDFEDEDSGKKKKKGKKKKGKKSNQMVLGIGLGAVGLVVLAVAAFFMMSGGNKKKPKTNPNLYGQNDNTENNGNGTTKQTNGNGQENGKQKIVERVLGKADLEAFTNLLPNDVHHVAHLHLKDILSSDLGLTAFRSPGLDDNVFRERLGFSLKAIDEILHGEWYGQDSMWAFNAIHSTVAFKEDKLAKALGLIEVKEKIHDQNYFQIPEDNLWLEQFSQLSMAARSNLKYGQQRQPKEPLFLRLHDRQTLIVAHKKPMAMFLEVKGKFKRLAPDARTTFYSTIHPDLKKMLDKLEEVETGKKETTHILFSTATDLDKARLKVNNPFAGDYAVFQLRRIWDVTNVLKQNVATIDILGTSFRQREPGKYRYVNEIACSGGLANQNARVLEEDLEVEVAPDVAEFFDKAFNHKVEVVSEKKTKVDPNDPNAPFLPGGRIGGEGFPETNPVDDNDPKKSRIKVDQQENTVTFTFDLILDENRDGDLLRATRLLIANVRNQLAIAAKENHRHQLGKAVVDLGTKRLPFNRTVALEEKHFPQAAFPRIGAGSRFAKEPIHRVSWMASLLPFLDQRTLYQRINFKKSWRDQENWLVARTIVPQFLDPRYPSSSRRVSYPGLPTDVAATHFVGIAGVGLNAADFRLDDPAAVGKRGIFGYDRPVSLEEISKGRGLANTAFMIQVPQDNPVGMTPWIAGGGATVRGVPEKDSIKPFVGDYGGKKGAYVIMADGSVRFLKADIPDEIFQAMCTIKGPAPKEMNLDEWGPVVQPDSKAEPMLKKDPDPKK